MKNKLDDGKSPMESRALTQRAQRASREMKKINTTDYRTQWRDLVQRPFKRRHLVAQDFNKVRGFLKKQSDAVTFVCHDQAPDPKKRDKIDSWLIYTTPERRDEWHKPYMMPRGIANAVSKKRTSLLQRNFPLAFDSQHIDNNLNLRGKQSFIDYKSPYFADLTGLAVFIAAHMRVEGENIAPVVFPHEKGLFAGVVVNNSPDTFVFSRYLVQARRTGPKITNHQGKSKQFYVETLKQPKVDELIRAKGIIQLDTFFGPASFAKPAKSHFEPIYSAFNEFFYTDEASKFFRKISEAFLKTDKSAWETAIQAHPEIVSKIEALIASDEWRALRLPKDKQQKFEGKGALVRSPVSMIN